MAKEWIIKRKPTLLYSVCCLAAYCLLPLFIHPFLCLFGIFPLVCLAAGIGFSLWGGFRWEQPILAMALFVPAMFLHYNETAWIYLPVYGVVGLIGCSAGAWIRRAKRREVE